MNIDVALILSLKLAALVAVSIGTILLIFILIQLIIVGMKAINK